MKVKLVVEVEKSARIHNIYRRENPSDLQMNWTWRNRKGRHVSQFSDEDIFRDSGPFTTSGIHEEIQI